MSGQQYSVEITVGVLEKLAGLKKPAKPSPPTPALPQAGFIPGLNPALNAEVAALVKADAQLKRALQSSRRVGQLLLKQEDSEVQQVQQYANELLKKHSYPIKPLACEAERAATLTCYQEHQQDTLKCAAQVQAYSECAGRAFREYVSRVSAARAS